MVFNFRDEWVDETVDVKRDDERVVYRLSDNFMDWAESRGLHFSDISELVPVNPVRVGSDLIEPKEEWSYDWEEPMEKLD
uniref:Uncharacterized protein n=1 Tax=Tanacetum cinerariifolium TaxID=118510 RepID=A0A699JX37_TANCI|nr:hypothetical protein [Tanacetum cinerariifolium]